MAGGKPLLLVLTSTFPRWPEDTEPRFVLDLCQRLNVSFRVCVLAPHAPGTAERGQLDGVDVYRFRYCAESLERLAYDGGVTPKLRRSPWLWLLVPFFMAAETMAAARCLRREPVALIHAHWLIPQALCAWLAMKLTGRRVPLLCTLHGADVFALRGGLLQRLQRFIAQRCDLLAPVSEAVAAELAALGVDRTRLRILPMGVPEPASGPEAARDAAHVLFVGRVVEKKGVPLLIRAVDRLRRRGTAVRLTIAGAGPELAACRALASELGVPAEFPGAIAHADVLRLFRRATVATMPSIVAPGGDTEGLGLVALEAMSCGCPVVAADLPAVRSFIDDGVNGFLFRAGDDLALAQALERVLADVAARERVAAGGRRRVRERFGWDGVAAAYAEALGALLHA